MDRLNLKLAKSGFRFPKGVAVGKISDQPERVIQFGEGNFLRAFVDWMINAAVRQDLFNGRVVIVQPIEKGSVSSLNEQDGLYTVWLRGVEKGKLVERRDVVTCVSRGINPYDDWSGFLDCATNPELRFMISNTTEVGIAYHEEGRPADHCPASYPAKVTAFLHERYRFFEGAHERGMIIIPCELINRNGDQLKKLVLRYASEWELGGGFREWIENSNFFLNTLVDRIVTGYPKDEIQKLTSKLGYEDALLDTGEIFHLWVIEGDKRFAEEFPVAKAGCNVLWTDNVQPFRTRKVRILNGAHTMTSLPAYLCGKEIVREFMEDEILLAYLKKGVFDEILPTLDLPKAEKAGFAQAVLERFQNPFIKHSLLNISVNSVSKFRIRLLPSLLGYVNRKHQLPRVITFSLAALMAFYRGTELKDGILEGSRAGRPYPIQDERPTVEFFAKAWRQFEKCGDIDCLCLTVLSHEPFWGLRLDEVEGLLETVKGDLSDILGKGMAEAIKTVISKAGKPVPSSRFIRYAA